MRMLEGKKILVTGGCGSIGSVIVEQLLAMGPEEVLVFDHNESGHVALNQKLKSDKVRYLIGDICDRDRVYRVMKGVDIVFHAAALKHVPFCEYNPFEAAITNVVGTKNVVEAAIDCKVERLVGVSTDKAVNPINTMGASKLLSEKLIINAPISNSSIKLSCVRFGNVLNSVGSVIPIFREQIENGGPVTLTSDAMTRFFMTIEEAVKLTLDAMVMMEGREIFILKMKTLQIIDLAKIMIEHLAPKYGKKPEDLSLETIGIRPGEKLHEGLYTEEEAPFISDVGDMFILRNSVYGGRYITEGEFPPVYTSETETPMSLQEIQKMLQENGII